MRQARHVRGHARWACFIVTGLCLLLSGASARPQAALPGITLQTGEKFFRVDGTPLVLLGTNPVAFQQSGQPPLTYITSLPCKSRPLRSSWFLSGMESP